MNSKLLKLSFYGKFVPEFLLGALFHATSPRIG